MENKLLLFWLFLITIVCSIGIVNAMQCPAGTHTFSGGTTASDASLCIPDVGKSGPANTGTQTTTPTQQKGVNYANTNDQGTTGSEPSQPGLPSQISNLDDYFNRIRPTLDQLNAEYINAHDEYDACYNRVEAESNACLNSGSYHPEGCSDLEGINLCRAALEAKEEANSASRDRLYSPVESDLDGYYQGWSYKQLWAEYEKIKPEYDSCEAKVSPKLDACTNLGLGILYCSIKIWNEDECLIPEQKINAIGRAMGKFPEGGGQQQGTEQTNNNNQNTNNNPGSNSFNTNSDRGRDESGRMNPSIEGYLGDAYVVRSDGTKVIPGKELYLKVDDVIVCGQKTSVKIIFSNAGSINLGPNTEMKVGNALLDQYYLARGTLKTQLNWGTLPPQKLQFHTPNAIINVKGTEFIVDYNETANITIVYLNEGVLEINIKNNMTNLTAGNYLAIYSDGATWTNQLKPENWEYLNNTFYEIPDVGKTFNNIVMMIVFIDLICIAVLSLWMRKKIKNPDKKDKSTSKGTASLVLGILGIILLLAPYIGLFLSAIGFCLSRIQKANKPTGLATAGFVLSIIGVILNTLFLIIVFVQMFSS